MAARFALITALILPALSPATAASLAEVAADFGMSDSYTWKFPSTTMPSDEANKYIIQNWNLNGDHVNFGVNDIVFSADPETSTSTLVRREPQAETGTSPSPASSSSPSKKAATTKAQANVAHPATTELGGMEPVLRINYPQGSYNGASGGAQFYSQPLNATASDARTPAVGNATTDGQFERALLAYDIWFPTGYAWNLGGKLPGLRGGPDIAGCSGGHKTDGSTCFSTRLMWRSGGLGEVYAYIPTTMKDFCKTVDIECNSDFGSSLSRGQFSFVKGKWQTIWLYVALNTVGRANGEVALWYNGVQAFHMDELEIRSSMDVASVGGLYFSTFFGGDKSDWATPTSQYTYFRNMQMYAGLGAANGTGRALNAAPRSAGVPAAIYALGATAVTVAAAAFL